MSRTKYLIISGTVFGLISLLHLVRVLLGWQFIVGTWDVPMWMSWCAFAATGTLSFWAFWQTRE